MATYMMYVRHPVYTSLYSIIYIYRSHMGLTWVAVRYFTDSDTPAAGHAAREQVVMFDVSYLTTYLPTYLPM